MTSSAPHRRQWTWCLQHCSCLSRCRRTGSRCGLRLFWQVLQFALAKSLAASSMPSDLSSFFRLLSGQISTVQLVRWTRSSLCGFRAAVFCSSWNKVGII